MLKRSPAKKTTLPALIIFLSMFLLTLTADAATITWSGGGADNLASNTANWSGNALPQDGDDVVFDGTSTKDCTWDIYVTPLTLTIDAAYTGTITLNTELTVTGDAVITGGTFNQNSKDFRIGFGAAESPPYPPTGLNAAAISSSQIDLTWTDNSGNETGFKIERKTGSGGTYSQTATVGADVTAYADTGLTPGTTYYYRVNAYNTAGDSGYSNEVNATTLTSPTAVTDPATNVTHDSATLNGTVNPNGYDTTAYFELGTDTSYGLFTSAPISIGSGTDNVTVWISLTGFSPETTYHYRVVATNASGTSYGNDISFTTTPLPGTIEVNATLDGADWSGSVDYTISGPENINGASTPATFSEKPVGDYTITYNSGGPANAILNSISPSATQTLQTEGTITFTLNFIYSPPTATTDPATNVNGNSATLNATVNPNNSETTVYFEWGLDITYGNTTSVQSIGSGTTDVSVTADLTGLSPVATYHYRVIATNDTGTSYGDDISFTTPPITLTITSPLNGDTINRSDVMVKGTVTNTTGNETGVTVNGIVAVVYNGEFFVNHVPLEEGQNTITATATDTAGNTATTSITTTAQTTTPHVTLRANIESGIAPLTTYFSVSTEIPNSVSNYEMDYEGDGTVDYTGATFEDISFTYTTEGVYYPTVTVTDDQSITYTDTIAIIVLNEADLDALLRAKWEGMKTALGNQDINLASSQFVSTSQERYQNIFTELYDYLSDISSNMQDIEKISIVDGVAEYRIKRVEVEGEVTYYIYFVIDENGIWGIKQF